MGDQSLSCNPLSILPEWAMPLCLEKMDARGIFFFMRHFFSLLPSKKKSQVCVTLPRGWTHDGRHMLRDSLRKESRN